MARTILPAFLLLLAGCAGTEHPELTPEEIEPAELMVPPTFEYRVGPSDVLRVNVFGQPELSSQVYAGNTPGTPVDGGGAISLPLIGRLEVAGMTTEEIEGQVHEELAVYLKEPRVDVAVIEFGAHRVFVFGEVQKPGMIVLDRPMLALEVLSLAGGFTNYANREQVALVRSRGDEPLNVRVFDADEPSETQRMPLQGGDVLFVTRRQWAEIAQAAQDLVPILQAISLPVSTVRDIAIYQDLRNN